MSSELDPYSDQALYAIMHLLAADVGAFCQQNNISLPVTPDFAISSSPTGIGITLSFQAGEDTHKFHRVFPRATATQATSTGTAASA